MTIDQEELEEIFQIFDTKGDGCISINQLGEALRAMRLNPTEAELKKCSESLLLEQQNKKQEKDLRISFEVFIPIYQQLAKNKDRYSFEEIVDGLRNFDTDGSGTIAVSELRHLLTALGEKLTDDEVDKLIDKKMVDEQGRINYEHFVQAVMKDL